MTIRISLLSIFIAAMLILPALAYPQRIVSGMPSITEMLFALDLGDRVVGVTTNCDYPPAALKKERVGGFFLNLEKVVSLKPDLVVMLEDAQKRDIERFREQGLNVFSINPHTVDEVMADLLALGKMTGKEDKARTLVGGLRRRLERVPKRKPLLGIILRSSRAVVVIGDNPLVLAGGGTFIDDVIKRAGGINLAAETRAAYPQYSFEGLLKEDPECIIIPAGLVKLGNDPRWQQLSAVKKDKVLLIDADVLTRPGPRVVDAVEMIARFMNSGS